METVLYNIAYKITFEFHLHTGGHHIELIAVITAQTSTGCGYPHEPCLVKHYVIDKIGRQPLGYSDKPGEVRL